MSARMPRSISIAGHPVKVVRVARGNPLFDGDEEKTDHLGICQFYDNRIAISDDQARSQQRDTLLHEVLHALVRVARLHRAPTGPLSNFEKEEMAVALLATQLLDTLRRNPGLSAFLLERDDPTTSTPQRATGWQNAH